MTKKTPTKQVFTLKAAYMEFEWGAFYLQTWTVVELTPEEVDKKALAGSPKRWLYRLRADYDTLLETEDVNFLFDPQVTRGSRLYTTQEEAEADAAKGNKAMKDFRAQFEA